MYNTEIPHNNLTIEAEEKSAALKVLNSGWLTSAEQVKEFENDLCNFFSLPDGHAMAVSSGSAALYLSLWALNAKNKKIGIPVYSCCSLRNATHLIGGTPVYIDSSVESPNIDINEVKNKNIDILIAPSLYGIPLDLTNKYKFKVIEDISQAIGSKVKGKKIGLRGDVGVCSFASTKLITSGGQGGVIISKNKSIIKMLKDYRDFDNRDDEKIRFNFLMTNMQAAIGRVQLKKLPLFLKKREDIFQQYYNSGLHLLNPLNDDFSPVRHRAILISPRPNEVIKSLKINKISSIIPLRKRELLDSKIKYRNAEKFTKKLVAIPMYPRLSKNHQLRVIKVLQNISK